MKAASEAFFRDGGKAFEPAEALHARAMFEAAVRRVEDLKARRAKAWSSVPIFFVSLDWVESKADNGLAMIALSRIELDEMMRQLTAMLAVSDHAFDTIAQELQVGMNPKGHPQYRQFQEEFADASAKGHLMLGAELQRLGDVTQARSHWQKGLERARDGQLRTALREHLDGK